MSRSRPSITTPCVADRYAGPDERIAEVFSRRLGVGCLIAVRESGDRTRLIVEVYNADAGVYLRHAGKDEPLNKANVPEPAPEPPAFQCDTEEQAAREGWKKCAKLYKLDPEWLGREYIRPTGEAAILLGLNTARSRFPVFVRRPDGLTYNVTTTEVRRALGGAS